MTKQLTFIFLIALGGASQCMKRSTTLLSLNPSNRKNTPSTESLQNIRSTELAQYLWLSTIARGANNGTWIDLASQLFIDPQSISALELNALGTLLTNTSFETLPARSRPMLLDIIAKELKARGVEQEAIKVEWPKAISDTADELTGNGPANLPTGPHFSTPYINYADHI